MVSQQSPLNDMHERDGARFLAWGEGDGAIRVVESFGPIDSEYAHARKGCVLFDRPHRGTVEITGDDRVAFLDKMVTQGLGGIEPFEHRASFWLNRRGRIVADLRLCELPDRMLVECDALDTDRVVRTLTDYVFAEEVELADAGGEFHRLGVYGPSAAGLIELAGEYAGGPEVADLAPGCACEVTIAGSSVLVERVELTGDVCLELTLPRAHTVQVYDHLCAVGELPPLDPDTGQYERKPTETQRAIRMRRSGWLAVNVARIEAGTPSFMIDFGPKNLPAESGLLDARVSFTKGCYLGQEIVARMHAHGSPKQRLVALRFADASADSPQPRAGAQVYSGDGTDAQPVGVVTSSTISPMLGGEPVMLAMVRTSSVGAGALLRVEAEGVPHAARVQDALAFWKPPIGSP